MLIAHALAAEWFASHPARQFVPCSPTFSEAALTRCWSASTRDRRATGTYIQVRLRDNNVYELEYRDATPAERCQTLTVSLQKVTEAFIAWADSRTEWKDGFMWTNIGHMFAEQVCTDS